MKFIVDLADAGHDVRHWSSIGYSAAIDEDIAAFARVDDAIVLTRDLDFSAILAMTRLSKPSVVHLRDDDTFDLALVSRVLITLKAFETQLMAGAILSMSGHRARIRPLPLSESRTL